MSKRLMPLVLLACALSCGGKSQVLLNLPGDQASSFFVKEWLAEEQAVMTTCGMLEETSPAALANASSLKPAAAQALRAEFRDQLATMLGALDTPASACNPDEIASRLGAPGPLLSASCRAAIDARLPQSGSCTIDRTNPKDLFRLGLCGRVNVQALESDPVRVVRSLDLSEAAVASMVSIANEATDGASQIASVFSVGQGIARAVVERLAAEAVAQSLEGVLARLEKQKLLHTASMSRAACAIFRKGEPRELVTSRFLRRTILRFSGVRYPTGEICSALRQSSGADVCAEAMKRAAVGSEQIDAPSAERITIQPPALDSAEPARMVDAQVVLAAAKRCGDLDGGATADRMPECIRRVASISKVAEGTLDDAALLQELKRVEAILGAMHGQVQNIQDRLGRVEDTLRDMNGDADALRQIVRQQHERCTQAQGQVLTMLMSQQTACPRHLESLVRERQQCASMFFGIQAVDCKSSTPFWEGTLKPAQGDPVRARVRLKLASACDPREGFGFELIPDSASFPRCSDQVTPEMQQVVASLAAIVARTHPRKVEIVGHSDTRPVASCVKFRDNYVLSDHRAKAAVEGVRQTLGQAGAGIELLGIGHGASEPLSLTCAMNDEPCHAVNRRFSVRLEGALMPDLPLCGPVADVCN
jgi:flagellar motor protein MotB